MKLIKGDCLIEMQNIPDGSVDAIITDPPYGTTACKWDSVIDFELMWEQLNRIIKPNGAIVLFGSEPFSSALRMSNIKNYKYDITWEKPKGTGHLNAKKQPMRYTETISIFYKKQCVYNPQMTTGHKPSNKSSIKSKKQTEVYGKFEKQSNGGQTERYPKNILKFNNVNSAHNIVHPTQKPIALMEYLIKTYTNENETVLDFTMGSGSTMVACQNTNRNGIGIEMDENYFNIATKRIKENEYNLFT
jgi:site-specific DNA-methyltransferase (adenine-specific)